MQGVTRGCPELGVSLSAYAGLSGSMLEAAVADPSGKGYLKVLQEEGCRDVGGDTQQGSD